MKGMSTNGDNVQWALAGLVLVATIALFWVVPEFPLAHLDDPSHWGVVGYAVTVVLLGRWFTVGPKAHKAERRLLVRFLVGMPLIYLADWLRFGGPGFWLPIELGGGLVYWIIAWLTAKKSPWLLPVGITGHAIWDLLHVGRTSFVPDWYAVGCLVVDVALGLYVFGRVRAWRPLLQST